MNLKKESLLKSFLANRTLKIVFIYFVVSALWIFFSDKLAFTFISNPVTLNKISIFKGWFFVIVTTILLYRLIGQALQEVMKVKVKLNESEERWKFALEGAGDGVFDWNVSAGKIYFSPVWKKMIGYENDELQNDFKEWDVRLHPSDREKVYREIDKHLSGQTPFYSSPHRLKTKDGSFKWILARGKIVEWAADGKPARMIGTHSDISLQKESEAELIRLNHILKIMTEVNRAVNRSVNESELLKTVCNIITETEGFRFAWIGYKVDDKHQTVLPISQSGFEAGYLESIPLSWGDVQSSYGPTGTAIRTGTTSVCQNILDDSKYELWLKEAERRAFTSSIAVPLKNQERILGALTIYASEANSFNEDEIKILENMAEDLAYGIQSIRIRKLSEQNQELLKKSESKYKNLFESNPHPMWVYEIETFAFLDVNDAAVMQYGYSKNEFMSMSLMNIRPKEDIDKLYEFAAGIKSNFHKSGVWRHLKKDGTLIDVEISSHDIIHDGKKARLVLSVDVTERKKAEEALEVSEERFRSAFQTSPDSITITGLEDDVYLEINDGFIKTTGFTRDEVIGKPSVELNLWSNPDDSKTFIDALKKDGKVDNMEVLFLKKDGTAFTGLISATIQHLNGIPHILSIIRNIDDIKRTQEALLNQEKYYRALFDLSPSGIIVEDTNGNIIEVNNAYCNITGYTHDELVGKNISIVVSEDHLSKVRNNLIELLGGKFLTHDVVNVCKDGTLRNLELRETAVKLPNGQKGILSVSNDITKQKLSEKKLYKAQKLMQDFIDNSPSVIYLTDTEGKIILINKQFEIVTETAKEKIIGKERESFLPPEIAKTHRANDIEIINSKKATSFEEENIQQGSTHFYISSKFPLMDDEGQVYAVGGVSTNITDRKKAEEKLKRNEILFRLFVEHSPASIAMFDRDMKYLVVSKRFLKDYNLGNQNIVGKSHYEIFPEISPRWKEIHQRCLGGAVEKCDEDPFLRADGNVDWVRWEIRPWEVNSDTIGGIILFSEVITDRKRAEDALRQSEEKFFKAFNNTPNAISITKASNGELLDVNESFIRISGYTREELIGRTSVELNFWINDHDRDNYTSIIQERGRVLDFETSFRTKSGEIRNFLLSGEFFDLNGEKHILGILHDITERKLAEDLLRESEDKYHSIYENSNVAILLTIPDGKVLSANNFACKLFLRTEEEICSLGKAGLLDINDPRLQKLLNERRKTGRVSGELTFIRKDGTRFEGEISSVVFKDKDGNERTSMIIRDMTEQKRAEEQLRAFTEQMRALATHLQIVREEERASIAREMHDELGQLLTSLKMNIAFTKRAIEEGKPDKDNKIVLNEFQSMNATIDRAVTGVRKLITQLRPELLDKLGLIAALEWYAEEFQKGTKINCEFKSEYEEISLSKEIDLAVFRIVQEATTNAAKHSAAKSIKIILRKLDDKLSIEIIDDGKGISEKEIKGEKSFGLLGMRERSLLIGGKLEVSGEPGKGTTVRLLVDI